MLDRLSFGGLAAEEELRLAEYFLETPEFKTVARGGKKLVLGEKGSGKTAIARYLSIRPASSGRHVVYVDLSPDLYLWTSVSKWTEEGVPASAARKLAWKLTIIQYVSHFLLAQSKLQQLLPDRVAAIRSFLHESGLFVGDPTWWERAKTWGASVTVFWQGSGITIERLAEREVARRTSLAAKIEQAKAMLTDLLDAFASTLCIVVDRLDELWDNSTVTKDTLVALLLAVKELSSLSPHLEIVVLIRTDIYRELVFADKDKFSGLTVEIKWNQEKLRRMVAKRLETALGAKDDDDVLQSVFETQLVPPGGGSPRDSINYMVSVVRTRPRDLLIYCEKARELAIRNQHGMITAADILDAEAEFSIVKKDNLRAEFAPIFPQIGDAVDALTGRPAIMSRRFLVDSLGEFLGKKGMRANDVLKRLVEFEVLGIRVGDRAYFFGERPSIMNMIDSRETRFVIAPGLRAALDVPRSSRPSE